MQDISVCSVDKRNTPALTVYLLGANFPCSSYRERRKQRGFLEALVVSQVRSGRVASSLASLRMGAGVSLYVQEGLCLRVQACTWQCHRTVFTKNGHATLRRLAIFKCWCRKRVT